MYGLFHNFEDSTKTSPFIKTSFLKELPDFDRGLFNGAIIILEYLALIVAWFEF
jgi:hypothetical protein